MKVAKLLAMVLFLPLIAVSDEVYDASTGYVTQTGESGKNAMGLEASIWSDGKIPHAGTNYYVAANRFLYCDYAAVTNFQGDKLVLAGYVRQLASQYANRLVFPHIVMLPGSYLLHTGAGRIVATCTVKGTAARPAECRQGHGKTSAFTQYQDVTWKGDTDACVVFRRKLHGSNTSDVAGTFSSDVADAWSDYHGTAIFRDSLFTYIYSVALDTPAAFVVTNGATLRLTANPASLRKLEICDAARVVLANQNRVSIGDLVLHDGRALTLPSTVTDFAVTNSLLLEDGAKIALAANPMGDWAVGTPAAPVHLATFGPNVERSAGYDEIFQIPRASNAVGGVPNLVFTETENGDGSVSVSVGYREVVKFTANASTSASPFSSKSPNYSIVGGVPFSSEKDYYNGAYKVYVIDGNEYVFPGHSLTLAGGRISAYANTTFTCTNLYLAGGWIGPAKYNTSAYFKGNIHVQGGSVRVGGNNRVTGIYANLHGTTDLRVIRADVSEDDPVNYTCYMELKADNSDFSGRIVFGNHAGTNANLRIWSKTDLGGPRAEFTYDALSIADTCGLHLQGTDATFDDLTRGWLFEGRSTLSVIADAAAKVFNQITVANTLTKRGAGTLAVANVVGEEGATLAVEAGGLQFLATSAVVNLPALSFAAGTKILVDMATADDDLRNFGVDLSATTMSIPGGRVPVEFLNVQGKGEVAVATLSSAAEADNFQLIRPSPYSVRPSVVPCAGGKFVLKATLSENGTMLIFR